MQLEIIFSRDLSFFLSNERKAGIVDCTLDRKASVKDVIESFGVPHTEVGKIIFNGLKVDFSYIPESSGTIYVKNVNNPFDVSKKSYLRQNPLKNISFIADINVMKLGRLLLLLGFDVAISSTFSDKTVADTAYKEKRIVLTRDTDLLKRNKIIYARRLRCNTPYHQLRETLSFFGLKGPFSFFSRCTQCNRKLVQTPKEKIIHSLEPKTKRYYNDFYICPGCQKIFWKGTHYYHMKERIKNEGILKITGGDCV